MRGLLFSVLLVVLGQAHAEEAYTGELLLRDGLFYKPFQTEPFTGLKRDWYENGQLSQEVTLKDGKPDGLFRIWYVGGTPTYEATYKDGKREGLRRMWYENGQLWDESTWKNGKLEGLVRAWYENGQLESETCYSNDEAVDMSNCQ